MPAGSLLVDIGMSIARLQSDMGKAIGIVSSGAKRMESAFSGLKHAVIGAVSVGAITALGKSALEMGDNLAKTSEKFGISVEQLSGLKVAATIADISIEDLGIAFGKMSQFVTKGAVDTAEAALAFKAMGINLKDFKDPGALFVKIAQYLEGMGDKYEKVALAKAIFGRAGQNLLPVMKDVAKGFDSLSASAEKLNASFTGEEAKNLEAYHDGMKKFGIWAQGTAGKAIIAILEAYETYSKTGIFSRKWEQTKTGKISDILVENPEAEKLNKLNMDRLVAAEKEKKRIEELGLKNSLKLLGERADALALFYGDEKEMAEIVAEEDIKRGEIAIKLIKDRAAYAEDLRGTMDAMSLAYDPEADLVEGIGDIERVRNAMKEMTLQTSEAMEKIQAFGALNATVFRGTDGVIADMAGVAINAFHGMTDALTDFVMTGKKNFTDFANSVIADIMRIAIRQSIVAPFAQGLMGAFGLSAPVAAMASGGPVFGGSSYLVGERGPELFVPSSSGSIIPNGGGKGNVTVNIRNESGEKVRAKSSTASFDLSGTVIDIVLDGLNRNVHGLRTALGGA